MTSEKFQRSALLLLVLVISSAFVWMISDFLITLLFAAIFSSLMRPLYLRILGVVRKRAGIASGLTLLAFVLLVILPLFGFVGIVANQAVKVTQDVVPWAQENLTRDELNEHIVQLPGYQYVKPYRDAILTKVSGVVGGLGNFIFRRASAFTAGTLVFFLNFAIMLYAMFFFFISGPSILNKILYYLPLENRDEKKLVNGFRSMARATIKGLFVIGVVQGALAGLALWVAGVPSALFWGTVMAVLSMVPNIGSALVWLPACVYLYVKGQTVAAVLVFLWCALVVGSADNVLRPILVGKETEMPELMVFISTVGGLAMMGLSGFILGPLLAVLFLTIWEIYGTTFKDILPSAGDIEKY